MPPDENSAAFDKIVNGLNAMQNAPSLSDESQLLASLSDFSDPILENAVELKFDLNDLAELQTLSDSRLAKIDAIVSGGLKHMESAESAVRDEVDALRIPSAADRNRIINERLAQKRRAAVETGKAQREAALEELAALHKKASLAAEFYRHPQQLLSRFVLGDPKALSYLQQVQGSGHAELRHMSMASVATKNRALGWAVMTQLESLPRANRPFSPQALALALVGKEFHQAVTHILKIKDAFLSASRKNAEFVSGKRKPTNLIESGLRKLAIAQAEGAVS